MGLVSRALLNFSRANPAKFKVITGITQCSNHNFSTTAFNAGKNEFFLYNIRNY